MEASGASNESFNFISNQKLNLTLTIINSGGNKCNDFAISMPISKIIG